MAEGYRYTTHFAIPNQDSVALTGLEILLTINQGVALGYYLSGFQPFESANISANQRFKNSTPHPGPLPVRGGEGEAFAWFAWFVVSFATPRLCVEFLRLAAPDFICHPLRR